MIERQQGSIHYLHYDHLQQFSAITYGIFTRSGGHSPPPYASLNTSAPMRGGGDSIDNVIRNRVLTLQTLDIVQYPCVTLWQVHGAEVVTFEHKDEWRTDWACHSYYEQRWTPTALRKGDALITKECGIVLALSFADCVPLLFYDPTEHVLGIAHAGWRGTARGVAIATVEAMTQRFGSQPANIYAGIGPSIGACCYEVSPTVEQLFLGQLSFEDMPTHEQYRATVRETAVFSRHSSTTSLHLDLWNTNYNQLLMAGLQPEHIEVAGICTRCNKDHFFSHRGENGITGRFPVVAMLNTL